MAEERNKWRPPLTDEAREALIQVCEFGWELLLAHRREERERRRREEVGTDAEWLAQR